MVDILHQLLKGVVELLIGWVKAYIFRDCQVDQKAQKRRRVYHSGKCERSRAMDERFRNVPAYPGL